MGKLTERQVEAWINRGERIAGKSDGDGLTFTLSRAGAASWVLRYRHGRKQKEVTIGGYPDVSLAEARKLARAARAQVDQGVDLALKKRVQKAEAARAGSFRQLADDYLERTASALSANTREESRRYLDKDIVPRIGFHPADQISGGEIVALIETIAKRSDAVARRAFEIVSVVYAHGVAKHLVRSNPCAGLKLSAILGQRPPRRERRMLSVVDLGTVVPKLSTLGQVNALAIKIILATCVRKGELLNARWSEVDLESGVWKVTDKNSKTGRGFTVPLAPTVVGWFKELQAVPRRCEWVVPGRNGKHLGRDTLNVALNRLESDILHFTPHDLRSTARSHLARLGVDMIVAERCLNHSLGGLVAIYNQHDYMEERRKALELWATVLVQAEAGNPKNVTAIRAAA